MTDMMKNFGKHALILGMLGNGKVGKTHILAKVDFLITVI